MSAPVMCPVCGWDYVHPVALKAEPVSGDTVVYVNRDGIRTYPTSIAERIRGIRITTSFLCEEGHQWDEERAFHKGVTSQSVRRGPDWDDAELTPS
ncbi:MAG: hypothetical protein M3R38_03750 [Actinomycetota bacterium]|nr:hypothetical protein [Actinomycetota bacterium]